MTRAEFYGLVENVVEAAPGTVRAGMPLTEVPGWDSLAVVGFIAAADRQLGVRVPATSLAACQTVDDLAALAGDKVTP